MDVLHLALYAIASYLALRSLVSLMSSHRARYAHRRVAELGQQQGAVGSASVAATNVPQGKPTG